MKANQLVALVLVAGAVAIVVVTVKNKNEKKAVADLKDQQLAQTVKPTSEQGLVATENPVPGAQYFVKQPVALNYVDEYGQNALNYL